MKLTIIIPCYNVAPFIGRALMCLVNQSLTEMEIICVNDKSTDDTLDVLRSWEKGDLRIKVLDNKKHMGIALAKNRGLDIATGEYVGFMEPYDFVQTDYYERLIKLADMMGLQVACGELSIVDTHGKKHPDPYRTTKNMPNSYHLFRQYTTAIYRRDFLDAAGIRFPNLIINDDIVFEAMVKCAMTKPMGFIKRISYTRFFYPEIQEQAYWPAKTVQDSLLAIRTAINIYNSRPMLLKDYVNGAHEYFKYLYKNTLNKNIKMQSSIASSICDIFETLKWPEDFSIKNPPLFFALKNHDAAGVIDVLRAQKTHIKTYRIFGRWVLAKKTYSATDVQITILGIPFWTTNIK